MCTVTFIPLKDRVYLTSNRDEKISRKKAFIPEPGRYNNQHFLFPKDADAGGAWILAKENGDAAVLLNGAFVNHVHQPPYRKSRGIILLDLMVEDKPTAHFTNMNLENIEPFTVILKECDTLNELRWDGKKHYVKKLSGQEPMIWSSATLYDPLVIKQREAWFFEFIKNNPTPSQEDIFSFHQFTGGGDLRNDLLMYRDGVYSTVSITSIELTNDQTSMIYLDLADDKKYKSDFTRKAIPVK
ncbi:MAG TPA: NRDE family protein [Chitinophagaceae bacterium]|nr:NRDE family protein [Chitinophagaceae bacterium]